MAPDSRDIGMPAVSLSGLVGLLDLVERPAAAISESGTILGVNQKFHDYTRRHGLIPHDQLAGLVDEPSLSHVLSVVTRPAAGPRIDLDLVLRDGTRIGGHAEALSAAGGLRVVFLVLEAGTPQRPAGSAGTAALRHDVAGPLTAILGTAELLLIRGGDALSRDVRDGLTQILENCARITEILHRSRVLDREQDGEAGF